MQVVVDADACPSIKEIVSLCYKYSIECHLFCDFNHKLDYEAAITHYVSQGFQSVDMALTNFLKENDILITQDYGLACIGLTLKAKVINPNGNIYTNKNIDSLLEQRYINNLNRRRKIKTKNISKRSKTINDLFLSNLEKVIISQKEHKSDL